MAKVLIAKNDGEGMLVVATIDSDGWSLNVAFAKKAFMAEVEAALDAALRAEAEEDDA